MSARVASSRLPHPQNYARWSAEAREKDRLSGKEQWRAQEQSRHYDHGSIRKRLDSLRKLRKSGNDKDLLFVLNEGIHGNMDGMANPALWSAAEYGSKLLIHEYVEEIALALDHIAARSCTSISQAEKIDFFGRASHCFGSSALLLSGAGSFMYFHVGVVKSLLQEGLLPKVISGSSGGALVGSMVCTHTDTELLPLLVTSSFSHIGGAHRGKRRHKLGLGNVATREEVWEAICKIVPDMTFQEAFEHTGRCLNISVASSDRHHKGRLLNALTSPNVLIREAALASSAVPGIYPPVSLMARGADRKRIPYLEDRAWVDGSLTHDLPQKRLSRLYGVNHSIVSQAHPLVAPLRYGLPSTPNLISSVQKAVLSSSRAWLNFGMRIAEKPLSVFPAVHSIASMTMSVINQDYLGDINIVRPDMLWLPSKIVGLLDDAEIEDLIVSGERTSWPCIERIRVQTQISRTLSRITAAAEFQR